MLQLPGSVFFSHFRFMVKVILICLGIQWLIAQLKDNSQFYHRPEAYKHRIAQKLHLTFLVVFYFRLFVKCTSFLLFPIPRHVDRSSISIYSTWDGYFTQYSTLQWLCQCTIGGGLQILVKTYQFSHSVQDQEKSTSRTN